MPRVKATTQSMPPAQWRSPCTITEDDAKWIIDEILGIKPKAAFFERLEDAISECTYFCRRETESPTLEQSMQAMSWVRHHASKLLGLIRSRRDGSSRARRDIQLNARAIETRIKHAEKLLSLIGSRVDESDGALKAIASAARQLARAGLLSETSRSAPLEALRETLPAVKATEGFSKAENQEALRVLRDVLPDVIAAAEAVRWGRLPESASGDETSQRVAPIWDRDGRHTRRHQTILARRIKSALVNIDMKPIRLGSGYLRDDSYTTYLNLLDWALQKAGVGGDPSSIANEPVDDW